MKGYKNMQKLISLENTLQYSFTSPSVIEYYGSEWAAGYRSKTAIAYQDTGNEIILTFDNDKKVIFDYSEWELVKLLIFINPSLDVKIYEEVFLE